jgi:hypothetical protein
MSQRKAQEYLVGKKWLQIQVSAPDSRKADNFLTTSETINFT